MKRLKRNIKAGLILTVCSLSLFSYYAIAQVQEKLTAELFLAAKAGDTNAVVKLLAQGAEINAEDGYGNSALYYTISSGNLETALTLIDSGAAFTNADIARALIDVNRNQASCQKEEELSYRRIVDPGSAIDEIVRKRKDIKSFDILKSY